MRKYLQESQANGLKRPKGPSNRVHCERDIMHANQTEALMNMAWNNAQTKTLTGL